MGKFYEKLRYSMGNEDWETEQLALQLTPTDRVLCVTASGDRPLNLLMNECREIVSVDANPAQSHLLHLKSAALKALNYDNYLAFLGLTHHQNRLELYSDLREKLPAPTKDFWDQRKKPLQRGIIYEGATEKLCRINAKLSRIVRGRKVKKLFQFDCIEEQKAFIERSWKSPLFKSCFNFFLNPSISRIFIDDPGLYLSIGPSIHPGQYIYDRMNHLLTHTLAKKSLLLSLLFHGDVDTAAYSPYLTKEGSEKIKPHLDRLTVETSNVVDFLELAPDHSFDAFSLSDVASYLTAADFNRLLRAIVRTAKPGARFCLREFMSGHQIPPTLAAHFNRKPDLESALEKKESCFVYRFIVGTISP